MQLGAKHVYSFSFIEYGKIFTSLYLFLFLSITFFFPLRSFLGQKTPKSIVVMVKREASNFIFLVRIWVLLIYNILFILGLLYSIYELYGLLRHIANKLLSKIAII